MARLLLISNGNGEDLSAALLGKQLKIIGHEVDAFPFVGNGKAYLNAQIKIIGNTKEFGTGGLGYTTLAGRLAELIQGQIFYLVRRILGLLAVARKYDLLIAVGDVVPVFASWLTIKPVVTYLVAYSTYYEGKLRLPWPCNYCLSSNRFLRIFTRDQFTADDLTTQLNRQVCFLGNPFMDQVLARYPLLPAVPFRLGLLPGSRRPELDQNIALFLRVILLIPESMMASGEISLDMALVRELDDVDLEQLIVREGWDFLTSSKMNKRIVRLVHGPYKINIHRNAFIEVLQSSDVLFCMAGTAAEQAIGLAKPVVQLPGYGPQFTSSFAEAQRRLLGPTIFSAASSIKDEKIFINTASLIVELLNRSKNDQILQQQCSEQAYARLGAYGGTQRIVDQITAIIDLDKQ